MPIDCLVSSLEKSNLDLEYRCSRLPLGSYKNVAVSAEPRIREEKKVSIWQCTPSALLGDLGSSVDNFSGPMSLQ